MPAQSGSHATRLAPLAMATFAVGTSSFVVAGLLPQISESLHVSASAAGQLVTVFAVCFAISAPVMGWATSAMDRRTTLILALSIFIVGNLLTAAADTYPYAVSGRIISAIGAGIITSTAASTAAAITPPERHGRSLAFVLGGLSLSTAIGLPVGTALGTSDWHLPLLLVAALGGLALLGVLIAVPKVLLPGANLKQRLAPLRHPWILGVLATTLFSMAGPYLLYTYIGTMFVDARGASSSLTPVLAAWGVGVFFGTVLAGRLSDRYDPASIVLSTLVALTAFEILGMFMLRHSLAALVWAFLWGIAVGIPVVPQQHRLVNYSPSASPVLLGLNSSAVYLGIAVGGAVGGLALQSGPPPVLGLAAAVLSLLGLPLAAITRSSPLV